MDRTVRRKSTNYWNPSNSLKRILNLAGRNADKLKSIPRVLACMKMYVYIFVDYFPASCPTLIFDSYSVVATLPIGPLRKQSVDFLQGFLNHRFPTVSPLFLPRFFFLIYQLTHVRARYERQQQRKFMLNCKQMTLWVRKTRISKSCYSRRHGEPLC